MEGFHSYQLVSFCPLRSMGAARAAAVNVAQAPVVAFAENHCFPAPGWAQALIEAHRGPWVAVGPSLGNANPRTLRSWTLLLTGFGPCVERTMAAEASCLAWHNSSYKRTALLETGEKLGDLLDVEGFLQARLTSQGLRLWMQPAATSLHTNTTRWRCWFEELLLGGRIYASKRAESWSVGRRLFYASAFFLIPFVRFPRVLRDLREANLTGRLFPQILPCLGLALLIHALGEMIGYLAGMGNSLVRYAHSELYRWERLCPQDQQDAEQQAAVPPQSAPHPRHDGLAIAPRTDESVQNSGMSPTPGQAEMPGQAEISVILITPDSYETLRRTVGALRRQTVRERLELVIVGPSTDRLAIVESELDGFAGRHIVEIGEMTSSSVARAAGIRAATASVVAFTEDHSFPAPDWAEALLARHREPWAGVGPAVQNANPSTVISWANFLIDYGEFAAPAAFGERHHIPGHNSSYKRETLLTYGEALSDRLEAESPMQWDLQLRGHRFCLEPEARTFHLNYERFGPSCVMRFHVGRLFAANRARDWSVGRRAFYALASPLIPLVRMARVVQQSRRIRPRPGLLRLLPVVGVLLILDGLGEMAGYAMGSGRTMQDFSDEEFHRERFLRKREPSPAPGSSSE
jgi:GT2 family glycosyltransferase